MNNKMKKEKMHILLMVLFLFLNFKFIYEPLNDKYTRQKNKLKVIKKLEEEHSNNKSKKYNYKNIILSLESHFRENLHINYIKSVDKDNNKLVEIGIKGNEDFVIDKIKNIEFISENIFIENMNMSKQEENIIECDMKLSIH